MEPKAQIYHGDCRDIISKLPTESVHAIVTDPPYGTALLNKAWDVTGVAYDTALWTECLRVLKPGGHLLAFGATRTSHRMATAIEDSGFEIRDSIVWLYGSGFPKSLNISKAIDKAAGAERQIIGEQQVPIGIAFSGAAYGGTSTTKIVDVTTATTEAAIKWDGWGTALKPAHEPIVVARKPFTGTVTANVLEHGTGAINIDGTRVKTTDPLPDAGGERGGTGNVLGKGLGVSSGRSAELGSRWPANLITDGSIDEDWVRYFYHAKASQAERHAGGENLHPTVKPLDLMRYLVRLVTPPGGTVLEPFSGSGTTLAAAILEGFDVIGCELTDEYLPIIQNRIAWAQTERTREDTGPKTLFDNGPE